MGSTEVNPTGQPSTQPDSPHPPAITAGSLPEGALVAEGFVFTEKAHLLVRGRRQTLWDAFRWDSDNGFWIHVRCSSSGRVMKWDRPDEVPAESLECDCVLQDGTRGYFLKYEAVDA